MLWMCHASTAGLFKAGHTRGHQRVPSLASPAEAGVTLDSPLFRRSRKTALREVFGESLRDFRPDGQETEWSMLVTAGVFRERNEASEMSVKKPQRVLRVAAVSFVPVKFDLAGNSNRLEQWFREVKRGGAQVAVGPEGYVVNAIIAAEEPAEKMKGVAVSWGWPADPTVSTAGGGQFETTEIQNKGTGDNDENDDESRVTGSLVDFKSAKGCGGTTF